MLQERLEAGAVMTGGSRGKEEGGELGVFPSWAQASGYGTRSAVVKMSRVGAGASEPMAGFQKRGFEAT